MGNVKMANMLTNVFVSFFKKFIHQKCAINISQDFFRSQTVHELPFSNFFSLMDLK